jgi:hypothetical protein
MNMMTFIVSDGRPVALVTTTPATPGPCQYGFHRSREALNANREWNLINARKGTISRAQKWQDWELENGVILPGAIELNPGEFFVEAGAEAA